ncbi:MAG TPA: TPM domain-containing protein [Burkholderiales bacterium]|nr:TPM domain-containing protein [Burkholderiales bacterium]
MLKRWLASVAAGAALLLALPAAAEVAVPPLRARVTDLTGTLSPSQIQSLESRLRDFERAKGSQVAVLVLPSTQPETIEEYSIRVADAWKVGRVRVDDGVILVVAKNDRKLRIEVGYGLEGAIPDAVAKRVVSEVIAPHFRIGDFYGGIAAGTDALMKLIEREPLPASTWEPEAATQGPDYGSLFLVLVVLTTIVGAVLSRVLGRGAGALGTGALAGFAAWAVSGILFVGMIAAVIVFVLVLFAAASGLGRGRYGGWGGGWPGGFGGFGGGSGGFGGGWSGGGGGFGGGGASGSW